MLIYKFSGLLFLVLIFSQCVCIDSYVTHTKSKKKLQTKTSKHSTKPHHKTDVIMIPVIIHLDQAFTLKLKKNSTAKLLRHLTKNVLLEVEKNFALLNLNVRIKFKVKAIKFLKNDTLIMDEDASAYLRNYCEWQSTKKILLKKWYYSVLITGLDLHYVQMGKKIKRSTGRSYLNAICTMKKSCTIVEWNPKTVSFQLSHELAHSLGVHHDGTPNSKCKSSDYIMSSKYNPDKMRRQWSLCNKRDIEKFIVDKKGWCLHRTIDTDGNHCD